MSFELRKNAFPCLKAQMNLTGHFTHILQNVVTGHTVKAALETEIYLDQVTVVIRIGSSVNSLSLPANSLASARKVAAELEAIANGRSDTSGPHSPNNRVNHAA